ncbi:MAG TPA: lysoplasmalogenase [Anaerolineaceae bacterium]
MIAALLGLSAGLAVADWVVVWRKWLRAEYIFKPAVLVALIAWFWTVTGFSGMALWFGVGLVFSLLGDVCLLIPEKLFLPGLVAFLLAHMAYIVGFNLTPPALSWAGLPILVGVLLAAGWLYRRVMAGLVRRKADAVLRYGVVAYSLALTLMVLSALLTLTRPGWDLRAALPTAIGGLLFFASDSLLALDRFVDPIPHGQFLVHLTYHLGQIGLMVGVALHGMAA